MKRKRKNEEGRVRGRNRTEVPRRDDHDSIIASQVHRDTIITGAYDCLQDDVVDSLGNSIL